MITKEYIRSFGTPTVIQAPKIGHLVTQDEIDQAYERLGVSRAPGSAAEALKISQAQAQAAENSAAAENVPAPGAEATQAAVTPVYYYQPTVKPRFGLVHVFLLVCSVYLLKKIFRG